MESQILVLILLVFAGALCLLALLYLKDRNKVLKILKEYEAKGSDFHEKINNLSELLKKHHSLCANLHQPCEADISTEVKNILHGAQVLLVEDNDINREMTKTLLQKHSLNVDIASDGEEAVLAMHNKKYDLVLMDIHMPNMDGITATEAIRHEGKNAKTPIVALSASSVQGQKEKSIEAGMNEYLAKPLTPEVLRKTLLRWIADLEFSDGKELHFSTRDTRVENIIEPSQNTIVLPYSEVHAPINKESDMQNNNRENTEVVNKAAGLINVGGNEALYNRLLGRFVDNYTDTITNIRVAIKENDRELALRLAHTIKGVAASLGAGKLSTSSKNLEFALRDGLESEAMLEQASEDLTITLEAFNILLGKVVAPAPVQGNTVSVGFLEDTPQNSIESIKEELKALAELMENDIIEAGNKLQHLSPLLEQHLPKEKVAAINTAYNDVDFMAVENIAKEMLELLDK